MRYNLSFLILYCRLRRVLGGSYSYYDQIIRQEIKLLRDEAKLNLVFYFDGRAQHKFKDLTLEKRLNEREQSIMTFLQACQRNQLDNLHARHLPLPPMMNAQLRSTLQGMGVEIVQCDSEADQEIAIRCNQNDRTYCYGKDTDFLILRGCRYIPFNSLYVGSSGAVALHLYTRDVLADAVGLSETQLVEWCLLIGNDYTGAYSRTQFLLPNMSTQNQSRVENLEQLRLHIIEQGEGYRVTARDSCPELQEAIEFSRALYELEDLSHYNIITASTIGKVSGDNSDSNSTNDDVALERLTEVGRLSQIHKSSIDIFLENEDVRHQVIDSHKQRQQLQIIKSNSSESDDEVVSLVALFALLFLLSHKDHFSHITEYHIASIGTMLETVCKPPTHTITQSDKDALAIKSYVSAPIKSYPQIDVVYAAHYFQEICKYIGKTLRGNESLVTIIPGLMKEEPRHMFDVELFASLMNAHVSDTSRIVQSAAPQTVPIVTPIKSVVDSILHGTSDKKNKKQSSGLNLLQSVLKCPVNSITSPISDRSPQASESSSTGNDDDKMKELKKIDTHQTSVTSVEFKVVEDILPIDQHRDEILNTIETHRVTVIHGETGCGTFSFLNY